MCCSLLIRRFFCYTGSVYFSASLWKRCAVLLFFCTFLSVWSKCDEIDRFMANFSRMSLQWSIGSVICQLETILSNIRWPKMLYDESFAIHCLLSPLRIDCEMPCFHFFYMNMNFYNNMCEEKKREAVARQPALWSANLVANRLCP